ncbi:MAG: flavodoxin family protein [Ruminococcus sp.]|nr:flavodoxin family protein [Ruminococcus sp.]
MKIAIRYYTKSKKGNTERLAKEIAKSAGERAVPVSTDLREKVDRLFLVNAMYASNIDKEVKDFLARNKDKIGEVVNFSTSCSGKSTHGMVKKVCDALHIPLSDKEFHCAASWIFINKGLPSDDDFRKARQFAQSMKK